MRFDPGTRALYASTGSNYRQVPIGVVEPRDCDDVIATVAVCHAAGVPVLPRGGGTSLAGQCVNVAVLIDMSRHLNRVLEIDAEQRVARVEPGCVLDRLREAAQPHRLTFAPDPSTHAYCTLGGMIGNNSCGVHSVMGGRTSDNVETLDVLTYDGRRLTLGLVRDSDAQRAIDTGAPPAPLYAAMRRLRERYGDLVRARYPRIPRRVSGYGLDELLHEDGMHLARALAGSEGTLATTLEATCRLLPDPPARALLVLGFETVYDAADQVPEVLSAGPIGVEGLDDRLVEDMRRKQLHAAHTNLLPRGGGWLLVEFGGESMQEAESRARHLLRRLQGRGRQPEGIVLTDPAEQHKAWLIRESGLGATAMVPGEPPTWEGWEDAAVPPERLGVYLREFRRLLEGHGFQGDLYGHFGGGCVHTRINFDFTSEQGIRAFRAFVEEAADLVVSHGGSLSGEHGDGQARGELLSRMFGPELIDGFREFKRAWDPQWKMNPGKVVDANPLDSDLRIATYRPPGTATAFAFQDPDGFPQTVLRCVGVGLCRKTDAGTMCPSYMATRDEMHSTRGRARMLFEMMHGEVVTGGWRDPHVKESLDLCLACKACKTECPVNVDMATYKAEFLFHYYAGRPRPLFAYATGLIPWLARLASWTPGLANVANQAAVVSSLIKGVAGFAAERRIPAFAPQSFRSWWKRRRPPDRREGRQASQVVLWPDTFNDHFHPATAIAAVEVLELAGCHVAVPPQWVCCGRPLYDHGMLRLARRQLRQVLKALRPWLRENVPVVVLEPSCLATFRDELPALFPDDPDARQLSRSATSLAEFLGQVSWEPPRLEVSALVHGHCHQQALAGMDDDLRLLDRLGVRATLLDSGCCGMAGAFGFNRRHYEVSMAVGGRVLLPAVRAASEGTFIIADGFSCREQIAQATHRRALHLAELIRLAYEPPGTDPAVAERRYVPDYGGASLTSAAAWAAAAMIGAGTLLILRRNPGAKRAASGI